MAYSTHDLPVNNAQVFSVQGAADMVAGGYQFLMALSGEFEVLSGEDRHFLKQNDILLLTVGTRYQLSARGSNLVLVLEIRADFFALGQSEQRGSFFCNSANDSERDYDALRSLVSRISMLYLGKDDIHHLHLHELCYSLVFYLNRYHYRIELGQGGSLHSERTARIIAFIEQNFAQSLTLHDLSNELHLATTYLSKYIKQSLGQNFYTYLNGVRLRHALIDLIGTDQSVTAISFNNGFANPSAFIKLFKETYATTPNQYRRTAMRKNTSERENSSAVIPMDYSLGKVLLDQAAPATTAQEKSVIYPVQNEFVVSNLSKHKEFVPLWRTMINIGFSKSAADSGMREQIALAQKSIGFRYCRLQGVLSGDILPKLPDGSDFNYSEFDRFIEFLLSIDLVPFLDLTYRRHHLFYSPGEYVYTTGGSDGAAVPEDLFLKDISNLVRHCINTFGDASVDGWAFEVNYVHDESLNLKETPASFVRRMKKAYTLIRSLSSKALVGGCGHNTSISSAVFSGILDAMDSEYFSPDFISLCVYPYEPFESAYAVTPDPDFVTHRIDDLRAVLMRHKKLTQRLFVTAFGADVSARNYVNDTCHQATFLVKHTIALLDKVEVLGYWQLSDLEAHYTDTTRLLFGGNGLLCKDGIKKPGFAALELLRHVPPFLIEKGDGYLVTTNSRNIHHLVLYNYAHFNEVYRISRGSRVTLEDAYASFQDPETKEFSATLNGLPDGNYRVVTTTLSRAYGSLLDAWVQYGMLDNLHPADLKYFRNVVHPQRTARYMTCTNKKLTMQVQLLPHEIKVFTIIHEL